MGESRKSAAIVYKASDEACAQDFEFIRFEGTLVCIGVPDGDTRPIGGAYPAALVEDLTEKLLSRYLLQAATVRLSKPSILNARKFVRTKTCRHGQIEALVSRIRCRTDARKSSWIIINL